MVDQMPEVHEENSVAVENGDGDVPVEEQNLAHADESKGFGASQQECPVDQGGVMQDSGSTEMQHVDSKEDMFVDAPEELNVDGREAAVAANGAEIEEVSQVKFDARESQFPGMENGTTDDNLDGELERMRAMLEKSVSEKVSIEREYKEEREAFARELADLHHQIKAFADEKHLLTGANQEKTMSVDVDVSLHQIMSECSKFLESVKQEQLQVETTISELQGALYHKDEEIEDLNSKVAELLVSGDVASFYLNSVVEAESEALFEKNQHLEVVADRMLASLAIAVPQEEFMDNSLLGKITYIERCTSVLTERYNRIAYEIDQLRQCLFNAGSDLSVQEDFRSVLVDARDAVLELRKKEVELCDKLNHLEDENRELIQQADKDKETIGLVNGELGKTKVELEQEKTRCTNTKEKLSMAVTKGKALVQQRDALKQSLAEKVNELERCQIELQEKSSILEAAELSKRELEKSLAEKANELEKCLIELQEKSSILDTTELSKKELELSLAEKENELEKYLIQLQEKSGALEAAELTTGELEESLAGKTNEIEKYLIELQEKSTALEASELSKEKLVKSDNLIASLQETLSQRNLTLENLEEFLSQIDIPEELQSMDVVERVRWLVDERNELRSVSMDYNKLKDAFSLINLPENVSFTDLESCLSWLRESYHQAEDERNMLQFQIERLSTSLSTELQEKDYIQKELDDLACRYGEMSEKAHKLSSEKDQMVRVLLESSGMTMEEQEGVYKTLSDPTVVIDRCFMKIREEASVPVETSHPNSEFFERLQSLLYTRDLDLMLCEEILGEEKLVRSQVIDLSNELRAASQVLAALKEQKDSLQKDLERSEDRSALLREKLSMAVKKGKGLVQDRENLKNLLGERDLEIGKLKLELQQQESKVVECRDEINMLSVDLERIPKLEADLVTMKDQRDQLELFLSQSNDMLQRVIESIDGIVLPVESVPQEPLEKVNWLTGYINECHHAKMQVEQDLKKVKEEAGTLASKLAETQASAKVLEDALSVAENNISQLSDEKRQIEVGKNNVEIELQKAVEEACSLSSKFAEACATKKSLEDALLNAENNISSITKEKVEAQVGRAAAEMELEKVREEVVDQTNKLEEACNTIKSLEIALSKAESDVAMLTEQNNDAQLGRTNLENELEKLKDETASQASKLTDACTAIRSLEDAMLKAKNDFSALEDEKRSAEQELLTLNSKLSACMEELAGSSGSLNNRSAELTGYLIDLQLLLKDENLFSRVDQCFESKFKSLKDMDLIIRDIRGHYVDKVSAKLQGEYVMEENFVKSKLLFNGVNDTVNTLMENDEGNGADGNDICLCFGKITEGFKMRNKILVDKFEDFSTCIDEQFAVLLGKLEVTRDDVVDMSDSIESLKQKVTNMEITREEQEKAIAMLENDVTLLLSACSEATRELQFEVKNNLLDLLSVPEIDKLNHNLFLEVQNVGGDDTVEHQQNLDGSKYITAAEGLSSATRKVQTVTKLFERTSTLAATTIQDLKKKLEETMAAFEKVVEERDLSRNRVSALQTDVEELQVSCRELRHKVEDFEAKEDKWHEKEVELSSLCNGLLVKQQEAEDPLLSASQVRALLDKINGINIPSTESLEDLDSHSPSNVRRLFDIIDSIAEMQHQINLLSHEKEELELNLSSQILQIERLKEEVETHNRNKPEEEKINAELSDLSFGLEKIIDLLGGSEFVVEQTSVGLKGLLPVLEKQVVAQLLETENLKTKAQELGTKLLGSQRVVDELSTKVKVLEDSLQVRTLKGETVQDRGIYEPPSLPSGSEISEIEDMGSVGKNAIAPVLPAPQMRTMRKGSTDHLAINIDSESDHLINKETDEDKGHVFKSLNTSGLIPKQGKMIADRIDGIWVSGGRVLMSRPQARLGLIAYTLFLHLWLLGTIL